VTDEPMIERLERLERGATPGPWEVMFDYLDARPGIEAPTVGFSVVIYGSPDDPTDEVGVQKMEDAALIVAMRNDLPALLSQLREQRDRTSYWETLHDERVESLEAERDTWRQRAEEAEECIVWVKCDDPEHERLAALSPTPTTTRTIDEAMP